MSHHILGRLGTTDALLDGRFDRASERCIEALARAYAKINLEYLRTYRAPRLYESGVTYFHDRKLQYDEWVDIPVMLERRRANCAGLAPWRLAELWARGDMKAAPIAVVERLPGDEVNWHLYLKHGNGRPEDPSRILGMPLPG